MWKLALIGAGTVALAIISRSSLLHPRSHGFTRFLAWEGILGLFTLNVDRWFLSPFSWQQIISWFLLIDALVPLILGVSKLRAEGRQKNDARVDTSLYKFEKTTKLVTDGIYHYIRHPLYSSLLLLSWGIFFKLPSLAGGALAVATSILLLMTAIRDESECIGFFGDEYRVYMKGTRRFIPFLF